MKKFIKVILPIVTVVSTLPSISLSSCSKSRTVLTRDDWEEDTKAALNQCINDYGNGGKYYSKDNYVVFDFDNTSAIFDIAHQCSAYQMERMCYNLTSDQLKETLASDLGDITRELTSFDFTYETLINDIVSCYKNLETKYGPFSYKGVDESQLSALHAESDWIDFSSKLRYMTYKVVGDIQGDIERCKWGTYTFTGMTPEQVYDLEYRCLSHYSTVESYRTSWTANNKITGSSTIPSTNFVQGISVTENIKELYKTLNDNGIDIWIVSASQIDQVRAAADVFGLSKYIKGCLGLTNKLGSDGKYMAQYDLLGKGYVRKDNQWVMMDVSNPNITSGVGKSLTIKDVIAPNYNNHGPIMCFGDSTGDFNFCSEFKDTKLVVCFNRADRSVFDGGGLMSAIAMYQKSNSMTLEKANANGDTLFCLQGRDETKLRSFRNSNKTIVLDEGERLFRHENNYTMLAYMMSQQLTIKQCCEQLCIFGTEIWGVTIGFLDTYIGYHVR